MPILSTLLGAKGKRTAYATMRREPGDLVTGVLRSGPFLRGATTRTNGVFVDWAWRTKAVTYTLPRL